jgi:cobyrinic acid a,c-diamide synthase
LGYRSVFIDELNVKGHEFHYSTCIELGDADKLNCRIFNAKGIALSPNIYQKNRTIASYNHLYWGEQRAFIEKLLQDYFYNR